MKRWPARMPTCLVCFLLSGAGLFSQSKPRINGHTVVLDSQGKLLSWVARQERAYDHVVKLGWNFILNKVPQRSEEHTSELQSRLHLVCRLLLEKKKKKNKQPRTPSDTTPHLRTGTPTV